jgi:hypothetical protein
MQHSSQSQASEETTTIRRREKISEAPLHIACQSRKWIGDDRLDILKQQFPNINTDKWTKQERKQLRRNWKRILKYHPDYDDPKFAFGSGHDSESRLSSQEVEDKKKRYTDFGIMLRMAYKLDDRLICDIYMKCRRKFYDKSYFFNSRADVPNELEKRVLLDLRMNESPQIIAHKYNISPSIIDTIRRRPRTGQRFRWTQTSINDLRTAIESMYNVVDINDLLAKNIDWQRVRSYMESLDYELSEEQCYNKWTYLYPRSRQKRYNQDG